MVVLRLSARLSRNWKLFAGKDRSRHSQRSGESNIHWGLGLFLNSSDSGEKVALACALHPFSVSQNMLLAKLQAYRTRALRDLERLLVWPKVS